MAGSPEYAFNEYLELALTKGIAVCAMMMIITLGCLRIGIQSGRYGICGAMIVLLIFSFSSYPIAPSGIHSSLCLFIIGLRDRRSDRETAYFMCLFCSMGWRLQ